MKKKLICLVLVLAMVFAFSSAAYAYSWNAASCIEQVKNYIVKSVLSYENFLTKAIVRLQFKTVAKAGAAMGCATAADLLEHSLQNNPENINYQSSSKYAKQILNSAECRNLINQFKLQADQAGSNYYETSGSIELRSTTDLYLSYNSVSYRAVGTKGADNKWSITFTFEDTYDFSKMAWEQSMSAKALVAVINNYAYYAQSLHAIVPYHITITASAII